MLLSKLGVPLAVVPASRPLVAVTVNPQTTGTAPARAGIAAAAAAQIHRRSFMPVVLRTSESCSRAAVGVTKLAGCP